MAEAQKAIIHNRGLDNASRQHSIMVKPSGSGWYQSVVANREGRCSVPFNQPDNRERGKMTTENQAPDIVMWVGAGFYPTKDSYIKESLSLGCAKRIPVLPEEVKPGKSRCFLAHDEGKKGKGEIFGFFVISGVEIILDDEEKINKYQTEYEDLNVQAVSSTQVAAEPYRLCGQRHYGAKYLVSENNMDKVFEAALPLAEKADIQGSMVVLLQPIPYPRIRFRGWRYMEPEFLEKYDWPQRSLPVKRTVKIERKEKKQVAVNDLPLFSGEKK